MAVEKNITVDQGANKVEILTIEVLTDPSLPFDSVTNPYIPMDFTGYTARMHVRKAYDSATPEISLTNVSGITLGASGKLTITITPTHTDSIRFTGDSLECVYDLELVSGSTVARITQGTFTINRNVTR